MPSYAAFLRQLVRWAVRKGRCALFATTGLGKTRMQLEWARLVGERTLILAPLAVAQQTVREADTLGIKVAYARSQSQAADRGLTTRNYYELVNVQRNGAGQVTCGLVMNNLSPKHLCLPTRIFESLVLDLGLWPADSTGRRYVSANRPLYRENWKESMDEDDSVSVGRGGGGTARSDGVGGAAGDPGGPAAGDEGGSGVDR